MRISGAPSVIRKRAAAFIETTDSLNLQKNQKKLFPHPPRTGVLEHISSNGSLEPARNIIEDDSFNCKPASVTATSSDLAPRVGQVGKEDINIEEDDCDGTAAETTARKHRNLEAYSLQNKTQGHSRIGELSGRKKGRLGVGFIKPVFKQPLVGDARSGDSKHLESTNVFPKELNCSTSSLKNPRRVEVQQKTEEKPSSNYYSVMYCTRKLNAKHKGPWSDGILISRGRSCILQDTEGKIVTKDTGHRCGDMSEGATFPLGKFEVEIMKNSTEEEFLSGKIFAGTFDLQENNVVNLAHKRSLKSFKRPFVTHSIDGTAITSTTVAAISHLTTQDSLPTLGQKSTSKQKVVGERQAVGVKEDALVLNAREIQRGAMPVVVDPYIASKLRQHQQEGVRFMYECVMGLRNQKFGGCLLADAMGLGKTLQVIALIWTLLHQGPQGRPAVKRVLVICPSSLVENWGKEVRKWLGSERLNALIIHSGTSSKDVKRKISTFQIGKLSPVLVTSYEFLRKYNDDLRSAKPELLVCDEAHRLKNCAGNKTIDALLALKCSMKVLLTGTPVQNDLMEFYAMLDFANKDLLGPVSAFKRLYADPIEKVVIEMQEEKYLGRKRSAELQLRTRPYILQRSSDVNLMYLPSKTELVVFCKLQAPQISLYQQFLNSKTVETLFHSISQSAVILSAIGTLRKLCNHPKLVHAELTKEKSQSLPDGSQDSPIRSERIRESDWTLSGKLDCLYKIMSAVHASTSSGTKDKIVVVSNFTQTLDIIQTLCEAQGWKWLRLDGSTEVSDRQTKVDRFNADYGEEGVFLLSSKAGGSGLNLVGANRLVLFDPDWNPATDAQAMARVWRDGQKKPVLIYRLLSTGSIEEKIYQRQIMKQEVAAAVGEHLDGQSSHGGRHFSREELRELFTLRLDTRCDTYDLLTKSTVRRSESWRDHSDELQDYALQKAIQTGVVTFIQRKVDKVDIRSFDRSNGEDDAASKPLEKVTDIDNHRSDKDGIQSCSFAEECSQTVIGDRRPSQLSNGYSPARTGLHSKDLEEDKDRRILIENSYLSSLGTEPTSPPFARTELEDHEDLRVTSTHGSEPVSIGPTDVEVQYEEVNNDHPDLLERSPETPENVDLHGFVSVERVSEEKTNSDVETDSRTLDNCPSEERAPSWEKNSSLKTPNQADMFEPNPSTNSIQTTMDPICQSEKNCCCLLGGKGHKLLDYMLETLKSTAPDVDDLEALDMPFFSSLELEVELQRAEFTPQKLWEGFKLFVLGFLLGAKQEQIVYSCSTLGLILDKCSGDKNSTTESVFCKGLPPVISVLNRRYGRDAVELSTLLSLYENKGELLITPIGRFLTELTRLCKWSDETII